MEIVLRTKKPRTRQKMNSWLFDFLETLKLIISPLSL